MSLTGRVAEERLGEEVHGVALVGLEEGVGEHGVEERAGDLEPVVEEDGEVVLEVVADLLGGAGEDRAEVPRGASRVGHGGRYQASPAFHEKAMPRSFASKRSSEVVSMSKQKRFCFSSELGEELLPLRGGVGEVVVVLRRPRWS